METVFYVARTPGGLAVLAFGGMVLAQSIVLVSLLAGLLGSR